jgi:Zn-dependent protease with chaperone function
MNESSDKFSKLGFTKSFVFPALSIFLVPAVSFAFFLHAQGSFDANVRESILGRIRADPTLGEQDRAEAVQFFADNPMSTLITKDDVAAQADDDLVFYYATFRWMIRLSALSIVSSVTVLLLGGVCVLLSLRSPKAQYMSLSAGWNVLRVFAALQTVTQGAMLVALSYWITALWFNVYIEKLIFVVALSALGAVAALIRAIFAPVKFEFNLEGAVLDHKASPELWNELRSMCDKVGTAPPDQVIAGIDDNFFVTELPITVGNKTYHGRTLYVSLPLLKQLQGREADAVLAHEMAHFSGNDTLYTKKTAPQLIRYNNYLQALHKGGISLPIFYFMLCFRGLFELSLGKVSREREFRADRIATDTTSPSAMVGALLRISAYSKYRKTIEKELFDQEQVLDSANISERIEEGFPHFANSFLSDPSVGAMQTAHPFDSHPPLVQRLAAVGVQLESADAQQLLVTGGGGEWHRHIENSKCDSASFTKQRCRIDSCPKPSKSEPSWKNPSLKFASKAPTAYW